MLRSWRTVYDDNAQALARIRRAMNHLVLSKDSGLRLELAGKEVFLKWDSRGCREDDIVLRRQGISIFIDSETYLHLADYILDYECARRSNRFMLRPRNRRKAVLVRQSNNGTESTGGNKSWKVNRQSKP